MRIPRDPRVNFFSGEDLKSGEGHPLGTTKVFDFFFLSFRLAPALVNLVVMSMARLHHSWTSLVMPP